MEEEFSRVVTMLAMNLIKVFPTWYHPSLTLSVTHAQMFTAYLVFLLLQQKKVVRRKEQMLLATSDLSLHQERPLLVLLSDWWGVHPQSSLGLCTSPFYQKNLNCSSLSPSRRCFDCIIDIEPDPSLGNVGNDKVSWLSIFAANSKCILKALLLYCITILKNK